MALTPFAIKRGDTLPRLQFQFFKSDGITPIDLTSVQSAMIVLRKQGQTAVTLKKACTITSASTGELEYRWVAGDTDSSGTYDGEVEITWSSGDVQTLPIDTFFTVIISPDLG